MVSSKGIQVLRKQLWSTSSLIVGIAFLQACEPSPTQSAMPNLAGEQAAMAGSADNVPFALTPPAEAPYQDASGRGKIDGQFLSGEHPNFGAAQGLRLELKGLPCRCYFGGAEAREFYTVYISTTSTSPVRLFSFNTSFLSSVGSEFVMPVPLDVPIFDEVVTVEVYLETDDGEDAPGGSGVLVLRGQVGPA